MTDKLTCKICSSEPAKECGKLPYHWETDSTCACCFPYTLSDSDDGDERDVKGESKMGKAETNTMLNKIYAQMCDQRKYSIYVAGNYPTIVHARISINIMIEAAQELNPYVWYRVIDDLHESSGITYYTVIMHRDNPHHPPNPPPIRGECNQYEMVGPYN